MATETVSEAEKMRLVPGIYFADEPAGRVAKVPGTGLGVWEIMDGLRSVCGDEAALRDGFHWLSDAQINAAFTYARLFPEEIEARLQIEDEITPEYLHEKFGDRFIE
ncbi:MAG TPA: hypothetical protein VH916_07475 [Dehalococcoidia bacterium]|jgi:uncharacterized protein (DUF433 family)